MQKKKPTTRKKTPLQLWNVRAQRRVGKILEVMASFAELRRLGPRWISSQTLKTRGLKAEGSQGRALLWSVEVQVLGAARMQKFNSQYRKKDTPTDVLSFPAHPVFSAQGVLGDLLICLPVLQRQAREAGHSENDELDLLLVHGVLHLLGLDHELGQEEAARMRAFEQKVLRKLSRRKTPSGLIERAGAGVQASD